MNRTLTLRGWSLTIAAYAVPFVLCVFFLPLIGGEADAFIVSELRLPRTLLGLLAGGALAITGACFQVVLRNPLAEPYTLGATGGAAVGAVFAISIPHLDVSLGPLSSVQIFALAGTALALGLVYRLARRPHGISMNTLLLAGVTISILSGGIVMFIKYLADPHDMAKMTLWLMGGLGVIGYKEVVTLSVLGVPGVLVLLWQMPPLNHLSLGDEMAAGHGVEVARVQKLAFVGGGLLTAAAVSVAGPIGFVGLIVPHAVRRLSGFDQRIVLPASFLLGGAFLAACDTAGRVLFAPREMPVGVFTAIVGGPLFIKILLGRRR